jgi:hypothetical protein
VIWRRRTILYAALALAIPLPALALTSGGGGSGLTVEASLGGCGVSGGGIVCEIKTSFGSVDGAEYYTASVSAPDGSVTDFGRIAGAGGGGTSLWVPYVGNGTYSVTVTAWGEDDEGDSRVIERDKASAAEDPAETRKLDKRDATEVGEGSYEVPEDEQPAEPQAEAPAEVPAAPCEPAAPAPAPPAPPAGEEAPPADPDGIESAEVAPSGEPAPSAEPPAPECPPAEAAPVAPTP